MNGETLISDDDADRIAGSQGHVLVGRHRNKNDCFFRINTSGTVTVTVHTPLADRLPALEVSGAAIDRSAVITAREINAFFRYIAVG